MENIDNIAAEAATDEKYELPAGVALKEFNFIPDCAWSPRVGGVLGALFVAMLVCLVCGQQAEKVLKVLSWVALLLAAITDRHARRPLHFGRVAGAVALIAVVSWGCALLWGKPVEAVPAFFKYQIPVLWAVLLWIALPLFFHKAWRARGERPWGWTARWAGYLGAILLTFCAYASLSAAASLFPKDSYKLLGSELLPYAGMLIVMKRSSWCADRAWWHATARAGWGVMVVSSFALAAVMILALCSSRLSTDFINADLFRVDADAPGTRRLQFLFGHHNRAGFFSAVAIFLCLAGAWGRATWRWLGIAGAAAAAFALPFTLTRGALVAAAVAMLVFIIVGAVRNRRGAAIVLASIVVLAPAAWLSLPEKYQRHISKITDRANYQESAGGSIGARLVMWEAARGMIRERPVLGFGYGFENFENTARLEHPEDPHYFVGSSHAHNHWLETAAETGVPGALLLFALTVMRVGGLSWGWLIAARQRHPLAWLLMLWLCLELLIQIYGMTNYTLRRNLGFLTYWIWAGSVVLVLRVSLTSGSGVKPPK